MSDWSSRGRQEERKEDTPPYSRLFVVCSKQLSESDLMKAFNAFGEVENIHIPRDRNTGASKGVAYIKYSKTSEAALARQKLDKQSIGDIPRTIKILVASNKVDDHRDANDDRYKRLFIVCSKTKTEKDLRDYFSTFGELESVYLQRDKTTDKSKGFAYIQYQSFLGAAQAYEGCDKKYRPIFATPRDNLKRNRASFEFNTNTVGVTNNYRNNISEHFDNIKRESISRENICSTLKQTHNEYTRVSVVCSSRLGQHHIEKLFNIIPGMESCHYNFDMLKGCNKAIITYDNPSAAAHAVERLHNLEYPLGENLIVKPDNNPLSKAANDLSDMVNNFKNAMTSSNVMPDLVQLAEAISQASSLIKAATNDASVTGMTETQNYCNINLPPPKSLADPDSHVVKRCFIICKPMPPSLTILTDIFCRFGELIKVIIMPRKTYGFVCYASAEAAESAINTLNGATVAGATIKVIEAEEKRQNYDNDDDCKRIKVNEEDLMDSESIRIE